MEKFDFAVYGNNTGAMISALELAKRHKVVLINPTPNWGAHFAGIKINAVNFDIGMNFFEFTTFHKPSDDLLTYDPAVRNDSARFFHLVQKYISDRIDLAEVDKIETLSQGVFAGDIVMANELDILTKLPKATIQKITYELEEILANGDKALHASQKKINENLFLNTPYWDVSMANHGKTFHNLFIEPLCKNIFNISSKDFPALLHRIVWVPLFYPESLLKAITNNEALTPTVFHYPTKAYFAAFLEEILNELKASKNITLVSTAPIQITKNNTFQFIFETDTYTSDKLIWCNDLQSVLNLSSIKTPEFVPQKTSVTLAFCVTESKNITRQFSCLYVCNESPVYRITNQEYSAKNTTNDTTRLVLEFNHDVLNALGLDTNEKIIDNINEFLTQSCIIKTALKAENITVKAIKNVVNLPTLNNFNNFEKLFNLTQNLLPDVELLGPASGFVSTSFNDQVVQALKIGKKYN